MQANEAKKTQEDIFVNTAEAAKYMGLARGSVYNMRSKGRGPDFYKFRHLVKYRLSDLRKWMDQHKVSLGDE
jgi:predicted DNA-binding transcriptional regulator AlpA